MRTGGITEFVPLRECGWGWGRTYTSGHGQELKEDSVRNRSVKAFHAVHALAAFVHMEAPLYLQGLGRKGPTLHECVLLHAVSRLALYPNITNIQVRSEPFDMELS